MKKEIEENLPPILDNVFFTKINVENFGKLPASEGIKVLESICLEWGLNIKYLKHFNISKKILINQIKNN